MTIPFAHSDRSTLGVEWEIALVDADSGDLRQVAPVVLDAVAPLDGSPHPHIRQELLLNTVEAVSGVCRNVAEAGADLARSVAEIRRVADPMRVELMSAGTHPFARWNQQKVSDKERYATMIDRTQWWGRQMLIYGVHVHVGIEDREKVMPICRGLLPYFAHLQSLSASSPFWGGKDTGYASNRALMFQQLPTAGLGFQLETWADFESYARDMVHTGVIDELDEIRWDIRPSPRFGTIETRICDGASNLEEVLALAALTHCLVEYLSSELDAGRDLPTVPPWFAQENKWRSARYGMDAIIILNRHGEEQLITESIEDLLAQLAPVAERLGCTDELDGVRTILARGAGYQRQRLAWEAHEHELGAVARLLVAEMRAGHPLEVPPGRTTGLEAATLEH